MNGRVEVSALTSEDDFGSLSPQWDALVHAMPRPSPFLLHGWLAEWWRHYGSSRRLAVVVARRDGSLVGAVPLYVGRSGGLRVARFIGGHESALADALLAADEPDETAVALLDEVRRQPFDYADLFGLPTVSAWERVEELPSIERVEAPVLLMPDGWDEAYAAKTSSKKRNLHRRRLRQLGELGDVEFTVGRTREELEPLLEVAFRLHSARWEGRPDGSTFGTEAGREFHRAAMRRLAGDDVLRLVLMTVGGEPAAFHYYFRLQGTMVVHRLGFDPRFARLSPGLVSTLETLRQASAEGATRVEFLGGNERYKEELADRHEPLRQAVGLARNPVGRAAAAQRRRLIELRLAAKRSERLHSLYLGGFGLARRKKSATSATPGGAELE